MRKILSLSVLAVLLLVFCGAPQQPQPPAGATGSGVAFTALSENEVVKMMKALPVFAKAVDESDLDMELGESPNDFAAAMAAMAAWDKQIPGLDAKLSAAGMPWAEFWPAFSKTMMAFSAVMMDSMRTEMQQGMQESAAEIAKLEAQLKDPGTSQTEKEMIKASLEMMKAMTGVFAQADSIFKGVPDANKLVVKKYMPQLTDLFEDLD